MDIETKVSLPFWTHFRVTSVCLSFITGMSHNYSALKVCRGVSSTLRVFWVSSHVTANPNRDKLGNLCSWKPGTCSVCSFISVTVGGSTPKAVGSALGIQLLPCFVQVISGFKNGILCCLMPIVCYLMPNTGWAHTSRAHPYSCYSSAAPKASGVKFCVWDVLWSTHLWRWECFLWWSTEEYFHLHHVVLGRGKVACWWNLLTYCTN